MFSDTFNDFLFASLIQSGPYRNHYESMTKMLKSLGQKRHSFLPVLKFWFDNFPKLPLIWKALI